MTPRSVHFSSAQELLLARQMALDEAFLAHPLRFKGKAPKPPELPTAVWINPPASEKKQPSTHSHAQ